MRGGARSRVSTTTPSAVARALDDLILRLRTNEQDLGTWVFRTSGDLDRVLAYDARLGEWSDDWFVHETVQYLKRTFKRLDVTSRSLVSVIEPGSCFAGFLFELALASDRQYMLEGVYEDVDPDADPAVIVLTESNNGPFPMGNGLSRLRVAILGSRRRPRGSAQAARRAARRHRRRWGRAGDDGAGRHRLRGRDPHRPGGAGLALARTR